MKWQWSRPSQQGARPRCSRVRAPCYSLCGLSSFGHPHRAQKLASPKLYPAKEMRVTRVPAAAKAAQCVSTSAASLREGGDRGV